ncbi:hypothetical protein [Amycolatopsis sp. NPDC004625]|uniref:hypothetical protein n=1 Tax=Amycolatopsis sp. NPDC004625 TaxID=3154670 RepID=UPI0033A5EA5B
MWTSEDALKELASRAFRLMPVPEIPEREGLLLFTRAWDEPFSDEVIIRGEDDATACRRRLVDGVDFSDRNHFVWYTDGSVVEVVDELIFHLPHPANPRAPSANLPSPGNLWVSPGLRAQMSS